MRHLLSRFGDWVLVRPVVWAVGSGTTLAVAGVAFDVAPAVIVAIGAATAVANIVHAKRRGYCPMPNIPGNPDSPPSPPDPIPVVRADPSSWLDQPGSSESRVTASTAASTVGNAVSIVESGRSLEDVANLAHVTGEHDTDTTLLEFTGEFGEFAPSGPPVGLPEPR